MIDNTYTWDAVPSELYGVEPTLESVQPKVVEAVQQLIADEKYCGISAVATRVFDRKGYYSFDDLTAEPRGGRNLEHEDVILQVTVRVQAHHVKELTEFAAAEGARTREEAREAERADIELQIQQLRERQARL